MVVSVALNNAVSSLMAVQAQINAVSNNIANASTPGYTEKTVPLENAVGDGAGAGVDAGTVQRQVDMLLNRDINQETGTLGATDVTNQFFQNIQNLIGTTQSGGTINTSLGTLESALGALAVTPSDPSQQSNVVTAAASTAQTINRVEASVQSMRGDANSQIAAAVQTVNQNLQQIDTLNQQIQRAGALGEPVGDMADQRDQAVATVAQYVGVQTFTRGDGTVAVYTDSGRALVDGTANLLSFTPPSSASASAPSASITLGADKIDVTGEIGSGQIGALLTMRDKTLPELSKQLNVIAQGLYQQSFAPPSVPTSTIQAGGNLSSADPVGSVVTIPYSGNYALHDSNGVAYDGTLALTKTGANQWAVSLQSVTRESDGATPIVTPAAPSVPGLPLALGSFDASTNSFTSTANPTAPPTGSLTLPVLTLQVGSEAASLLGQAGPPPVAPTFSFDTSQLTESSAATSLQPIDNGAYRLFTGVNVVDPKADNAVTITVNPALDPNKGGDPSLLFVAGDQTPSVAQRMADGLNATIDTNAPPYAAIGAGLKAGQATLVQYADTLLAQNATQASNAQNENQFQSQYVTSLQQQAASTSGVNVDQELAKLTELQNTYQASALIMTTINQMFTALFAVPTN